MHLPGQPDGHNVRTRPAGLASTPPDRGDRRVPPQRRVLLAPQRPRRRERVFGARDSDNRAGRVDQDSLRRGRRDVDAEDEPNGQRPAPDSIRSRSTAQICWLTRFSRSSWRPDTGSGRSRRTRPCPRATRATPPRPGSPGRADRPSPRSAPRAAARGSRAPGARRRRAAPGRACRCPPMCAWNRSVRSVLWRRSLASKLKPPVVNPPPFRISYSGRARSSTEFGNWSVSQPFCGSPRFASMLPRIPFATA